jgi:hypothetical protein
MAIYACPAEVDMTQEVLKLALDGDGYHCVCSRFLRDEYVHRPRWTLNMMTFDDEEKPQ